MARLPLWIEFSPLANCNALSTNWNIRGRALAFPQSQFGSLSFGYAAIAFRQANLPFVQHKGFTGDAGIRMARHPAT
jgi:hypothetical protein